MTLIRKETPCTIRAERYSIWTVAVAVAWCKYWYDAHTRLIMSLHVSPPKIVCIDCLCSLLASNYWSPSLSTGWYSLCMIKTVMVGVFLSQLYIQFSELPIMHALHHDIVPKEEPGWNAMQSHAVCLAREYAMWLSDTIWHLWFPKTQSCASEKHLRFCLGV